MTDPTDHARPLPDDRLASLAARLLTALALCALFWASLHAHRSEARRSVRSQTPTAQAAACEKALAKVRITANESDAFLVGASGILAVLLLVYEGSVAGLTWGLRLLANSSLARWGSPPTTGFPPTGPPHGR